MRKRISVIEQHPSGYPIVNSALAEYLQDLEEHGKVNLVGIGEYEWVEEDENPVEESGKTTGLTFGEAMVHVAYGNTVTRKSWGVSIVYLEGDQFIIAHGSYAEVFIPTVAEVLATDWEIVVQEDEQE